MSFGETLEQLRKEHQLTQQDLGTILGISKSSISNFERQIEIPDFDILRTLANYFNVSLGHLLGTSNYTLANSFNADHTEDLPKEAQQDIYDFTQYLKFKYQSIKNR